MTLYYLGMFYFKTDQYNAIFQEVEKNVKALACRNRTHSSFIFFLTNKRISF